MKGEQSLPVQSHSCFGLNELTDSHVKGNTGAGEGVRPCLLFVQ